MQQDTNLIRHPAPQDEEGIGLIDVFNFIQNGWKTIGVAGVFGLLRISRNVTGHFTRT